MNKIKFLNDYLRKPKVVTVKCTATTATGESEAVEVPIRKSQINRLWGNGLTGKHLYDLSKTGKCETVDWTGTKYVYEVLAPAMEQVKE